MFELFSEDRHRAPHRSSIPVLISTAAHAVVVGVVLAIPILYVRRNCHECPTWSRSSCRRLRRRRLHLHHRLLHQRQRGRSRRRSPGADGESPGCARGNSARNRGGDAC